jgi:dolichol-phosphate mannosyltransferase
MRAIIVLPTYNERENLERMLQALLALGAGLDIVVVDDDSPDGAGQVAEEWAGRCPEVHALIRRNERGLGTAYACGFRKALGLGADAIISMDCDFSHSPSDVPRLLECLAGCDIGLGSRYVPGGGTLGWPMRRKLLSRAANAFARGCLALPVRDCTSGFRAYRAGLMERLIRQPLQSRGYSIQVELLARGVRQFGAKVVEIPILFAERERGVSKIGWQEALAGCRAILRVRRQLAGVAPDRGGMAPAGGSARGRDEAEEPLCRRDSW